MLLDEAASLGHMEALDDAVDKYRGYGVRLQLYYQSLGQLRKCWPEGQDQTVLSNTTQIFFGVNDPNTAEYISQRLGKETILVEGWNDGETWSSQSSQQGTSSGSHTRSRGRDIKQQPRELLQVDEVMNLHERTAITFTPGKRPIWTWLIRYYEPGWNQGPGLSAAKMIFDTACLFLAAGMLAAMWTAGWYFGTFR